MDINVFSITDFAHFALTTRDTLIYYDKIGLLKPIMRGKNNYRYYSSAQLAIMNLISTFKELGMPLTEIKRLVTYRTPELISELLKSQIELIDEHIDQWVRARKLLLSLQDTINSALDADEEYISIEFMPAKAIVLGGLNDYSHGRQNYAALLDFYHDCSKKYPGLDINYPAWRIFSMKQLHDRDWTKPERYYFNNPEGFDKKPSALYAIGYKHGGYGQHGDLFERMLEYIDHYGYEICGPAYEEYPLNEISVTEKKDYLMQVMITVCKKDISE